MAEVGIRQREGKQYRDSYLLESYQMKGGTGKKLIAGSFEERSGTTVMVKETELVGSPLLMLH